MRIGAWYLRLGWNPGLPWWIDGRRYAPILAYVHRGEIWMGQGIEVGIWPWWVLRIVKRQYRWVGRFS